MCTCILTLTHSLLSTDELFWDQQKRGDRVKISTDGRTASASSEDQIVALNNWITSVHASPFLSHASACMLCLVS